MLAIPLSEEIEQRLECLARKSGQTKAILARDAILEYVGDLEDFYLADGRTRKNHQSIPLDDVERQLWQAD